MCYGNRCMAIQWLIDKIQLTENEQERCHFKH